jgi:hypothetical protein
MLKHVNVQAELREHVLFRLCGIFFMGDKAVGAHEGPLEHRLPRLFQTGLGVLKLELGFRDSEIAELV